MPIPKLERARVERALDKFCDRVPPAIRSDLTYDYRFRGNAVVLLERRPHYRDRARHTEHLIAKFVYSPTVGGVVPPMVRPERPLAEDFLQRHFGA